MEKQLVCFSHSDCPGSKTFLLVNWKNSIYGFFSFSSSMLIKIAGGEARTVTVHCTSPPFICEIMIFSQIERKLEVELSKAEWAVSTWPSVFSWKPNAHYSMEKIKLVCWDMLMKEYLLSVKIHRYVFKKTICFFFFFANFYWQSPFMGASTIIMKWRSVQPIH